MSSVRIDYAIKQGLGETNVKASLWPGQCTKELGGRFGFSAPDEVHESGHMAVQDRVLDVQQPAVKAIEGCNVGQLQRSSLCTLLCPQQQLTQDGASLPLCDEGAQDLPCIQPVYSSGSTIRLPQRPFWH